MLFMGMPKFFSPHNILVSQFLCSQLRLSGQTVDYWEVTSFLRLFAEAPTSNFILFQGHFTVRKAV